MADEDVVAISPPSDHKRKLDDVDADQTLAPAEAPDAAAAAAAAADADGYAADGYAAAAGSDSPDVKRPRLDGDPEVSETANGNGYPHEKGDEPVEENGIVTTLDGSEVEEAQLQSNVSEGIVDNEKKSVENHGAGDLDDARGTSEEEVVPTVDVNEQDVPSQEQQASDDGHTLTHKIEVPNSKVGVLIGKNGDTIRYLQYNSGVKIQIVRDAEADMSSTTRPVELTGTKENISKAEKLIKDVIAEADAGGSPSLVAKGIASAHIPGSAEQIELKVPNEKVGILIGRGGDTIKSLQTRSGARIQLIPQHLPEGDDSKERVVRLTGDRRQIDVATQMIKEVIKQTPRHSSLSGGFSQQAHRSRGSGGPQWGPRAPYSSQQVQYDYQQRGPYQYQNPQYSSTPYGGYPSPRSGFGPGWEQRAPPRGGSYDFFGGHGGHPASMPPHSGSISGHFSGQSGPPQSLAGYNYGQPRGANYGHPGPYSQAGNPQQNYGHGYEETKYENAAVHPSYGGQNSGPVYSQTAAAAASQTGYAQQYGSSQPIQQYGSSVPSQQAYQYPAGGSVQQTYPTYASAPTTDGSQPGAVYPQQVQAAPAYGQTATTGAYGSYPEQPATANLGYGYQASQDAGYGGGAGATYAAAPGSQTQPGYGQQPTAQLGYDQSVAQSGGYGSVPVSAQASYPQYDSSQVYGAR